MDIKTVVDQYRSQQLDAKAALEVLEAKGLLAEAIMDLLASRYDERAALDALITL